MKVDITWDSLAREVGSKGLLLFLKVWHQKGQLTKEETAQLSGVFARYPLGTDDFRVWLKQRTRQLFENSVRPKVPAGGL